MKYLQQTLQTSLFLFGGMLVLAFSLHFTNIQQTQAASEVGSLPAPTPTAWLDSKMPGTVPYLVDRVVDRWELWNDTESALPETYLEYGTHRIEATHYAFLMGNEDVALNTLTKAFGYLARTQMACDNFSAESDCAELRPRFERQLVLFADTATSLAEEASRPEVRSQAHDLLEKSHLFRQ